MKSIQAQSDKGTHTIQNENGDFSIDGNPAEIYRIAPDKGQIILVAFDIDTYITIEGEQFAELLDLSSMKDIGIWAAIAKHYSAIRAREDTILWRGRHNFILKSMEPCACPAHKTLELDPAIRTHYARMTEDLRRDGCIILMPICVTCELHLIKMDTTPATHREEEEIHNSGEITNPVGELYPLMQERLK